MESSAPAVKDIIWNDDIENLLKAKQFQCVKKSWCHFYEADKYHRYKNYFFIFSAVITAISSSSIILSNSFFKDTDPFIVSIINIALGGVGIITVGLNSFQHMTDYGELSSLHKASAISYSSLSDNMQKLLALDRHSKQTNLENFTWSDTQFTALEIKSPLVSSDAKKKYLKENGTIHLNYILDKDINKTEKITNSSFDNFDSLDIRSSKDLANFCTTKMHKAKQGNSNGNGNGGSTTVNGNGNGNENKGDTIDIDKVGTESQLDKECREINSQESERSEAQKAKDTLNEFRELRYLNNM